MTKGYTIKKNGHNQFIPTEGTKKSSLYKHDLRTKTTITKSDPDELKQRKMTTTKDIWTYDDAPDELKEKIIEKLRENKYEFGDNFFAEDQGLIYDEQEKKDFEDIGLESNSVFPKYYDVGSNRGTDYVQFELKIADEKKFATYLGIPESLRLKVDFAFENDNRHDPDNTTLKIHETTDRIEIDPEEEFDKEMFDHLDKEDRINEDDYNRLRSASEKFDDLMHSALTHLVTNYEYQFSDEALIEDAQADMDFDEDGNIA